MADFDFGLKAAFERELKRRIKELEECYKKQLESLHREFLLELESYEKALREKYEKQLRKEEKRYLAMLAARKNALQKEVFKLAIETAKNRLLKTAIELLEKKKLRFKVFKDYIIVEGKKPLVIDPLVILDEVISGEDLFKAS